MKSIIKSILQSMGLGSVATKLHYALTAFNPNTTHPHRLERRFHEQFFGKGDLCFDVGANVGHKVAMFLEIGAKVVAIEPQSICVNQLKQKFTNNSSVNIIHKGLSDKVGKIQIAICETDNRLSTFNDSYTKDSIFAKQGITWEQFEEVEITTLDNLITEYGMPKYCKIDVEGYEYQVLKGLTKPIPVVSFEFSAELLADVKQCGERLLQIANYEFNISYGEAVHLASQQWFSLQEVIIILEKEKANKTYHVWGDIFVKLKS